MENKLLITIIVSFLVAGMPSLGYAVENATPATTSENDMANVWGGNGWDPIQEMEDAQRKIDQVFKESFTRAMKDEKMLMHGKNGFGVNLSVRETKDQFIVNADLPGMKKEDINVELKGRLLTITGQRKSEMKTENEKVIKEDRNFGSFSSAVSVPEDVNTAAINAEYKDGVLTVTMPRIEMAKKTEEAGTKIPIK